jgi:putative transcriptional regulator
MTQQDLADRIGVSRQTLNATEGCKYSPSLKVAFLIAHTLNVTLNEVFTFTPAQTNETPASQLQPSPAS